MKRFFATLVSAAVLTPSVAFSQQTNVYQVCHQYQENYVPGYYNQNGSYRQGGVYTTELTVNCQTGQVYSSRIFNGGNVIAQPPVYNQPRKNCNPTTGALIGAGLAGVLGGNTRTNSGNWNSYYGKNYTKTNWSNTYQNGYSWQALGAGIGALLFSC